MTRSMTLLLLWGLAMLALYVWMEWRKEQTGRVSSTAPFSKRMLRRAGCSVLIYGAALAFFAYKHSVDMAALEQKLPLLQTMKTYEPAMYEEFKDYITHGGRGSAPQTIMRYIQSKEPYMDDSLVLETLETQVDVIQRISKAYPEQCVKVFLGQQPDLMLIKKYMDTQSYDYNKIFNVLDRIISAPKNTAYAVANEYVFNSLVNSVAHKVAVRYVLNDGELKAIYAGTYDPKKSCDYFISFFQEIAAMPPEIAAPFIRFSAKPL